MIGIVLISHGGFAQGLLEAATMIFGSAAEQTQALGLLRQEDPASFSTRLGTAIREVDTGDGVLVLADLLGGTPCNQAARYASDRVQILTGVNLGMLLEILGMRGAAGALDLGEILMAGRAGINDYNALLTKDEEDEIL